LGKPEAKVEDYLIKRVKELGGRERKLRWVGRDGAPDRIVWFKFPAVGVVEVKREIGGVVRACQEREMARMREDGWPVFLVSNFSEVDAALDAIRCCNVL